ncbi:cyclic nucleotide-binding domain-containing protein [Georgenia sp. M64]|uniref:cyclic nucleotide-binding domain-containing protein n=1 Tax=Georgenia sp. M64 TaxID=3120520 RepID=UPI0030DFD5E8
MRIERSVLSVSWLPSEAVSGAPRLFFDAGLNHYDAPPPDVVQDPAPLVAGNRVRAANHLRAWIDVNDGEITGVGYSGGGLISRSTVHVLDHELTFAPIPYPDLRQEPAHDGSAVTFVQTAGGHAGFPAPRTTPDPPFLRVSAPLIWTTLSLTIGADGSSRSEVRGASPVPRHWIYDDSGALFTKVGSMDFATWYWASSEERSPWRGTDLPVVTTQVETALERRLSAQIMRPGRRVRFANVAAGETLVRQGEPGDTVFLLLDGVVRVEVDDQVVADVGPGAVLGERAMLEGGRRTSTLRAVTACRVAVGPPDGLSSQALVELSAGHRREDGAATPS